MAHPQAPGLDFRFILAFVPDPNLPSSVAPSMWQHMGEALRQSVDRVLALLISVLPGLLALLLAIGVLTAIGMFLSFLVRRILGAMRFDERLTRNRTVDLSDWSPGNSPTQLAGRIVFWACVFLGLIVGVFALNASYSASTQMSLFLIPYVAHTVSSILLLLAGNLIARFLARSVLIGAVNARLQYARFLSLGVKWLVLVLTAAMVLDHLNIGGAVIELAFGILFGGIVLTLSLAIGLGSRDMVSRSLERNIGSPSDPDLHPPLPHHDPIETIRHF